MKPQTTKVIYWIIIGLFCLFMLGDGLASVLRTQSSVAVMVQLGFPVYSLTIIGIAKILGALALLQTKSATLKEWAYAGFVIDLIGAAAAWAFVTHNIGDVIFPLIMMVLLLYARSIWKKTGVGMTSA